MMRSEAWTVAAALTAGCCASSPGPGESLTTQPGPTPAPTEEDVFVAIDAEEAARRLWPRPGPTAYTPAGDAEATALAGLIGRMLGEPGVRPAELAAAAQAAGYTIEGWAIDGERYLAAIELPTRRRGGGAYVVRVNPVVADGEASPVILQAPHGFFDVGTERIALELLLAGRGWPRALFVNTVHRYLGADGVKRRQDDSPADPCHSPTHLMAVATVAALERLAHAEVVQLHGFGDEPGEDRGEEGAGPAFAAIVSGGTRTPTPRSRAVAERLRVELGVAVGLFPEDTIRLGATTNAQGRAIRAFNERTGSAATFVHVELAADLRRQLRDDPGARARLAAALRPPASGP